MRFGGLVALITLAVGSASAGTAHAQLAPVGRSGLSSVDHVLLERELTLDDGIVEIGGRVQTVQLDAGIFSSSLTGIAATVGYGVGDVLELWGEPVLMVAPQTELGFNLGASLRAVNTESFDMAPSFALPLNLTADGDTVSAMVFGLDSRVKLGSIVSLFFLHGLVMPVFAADTVLISANIGLGIQPIRALGIRIETRPLALETADGEVIHYGDVVPLGFDLVINAERLDFFFGVQFPDAGSAGDFYILTFGAMGRF